MKQARKNCYGVLDAVFPTGPTGLRETPSECFECPLRVACLRAALGSREGLELRVETLDRHPAESGLVGRVKRWSERKHLNRLKEKRKRGRP